MESDDEIRSRDLQTLRGIMRGPGNYATPSPERIERLMRRGLVKMKRRRLAPTIKGRLVAWFSK